MSFSKARIQRFNELGSEVPPPGAYDPKFDNKVKGLVIEKSDRFLDTKSTHSVECSVSLSGKSNGSISIPAFRTPQMPRKRLITKQTSQTSIEPKGKPSFLAKSQSVKYESTQQLADLQVECSNKDKTIQEHEKHIEEMKDDMRKLEIELEELHKRQIEIEEQHTKDIETMAKLQQEVLNNHDEKHQVEVQMLCSQLFEVSEEKEQEFSARKTMEVELRNRAAELSRRITTLEEAELCTRREENKIKIETLEKRIEDLLSTIKKLECDRDIKIRLLKEGKCELNTSIADLKQARSDIEAKLKKKQSVILELQGQLSDLQCQLDELTSEYKNSIEHSNNKIAHLTDDYQRCIKHMTDDFSKIETAFYWQERLLKEEKAEALTEVQEMKETNLFLEHELQDVQRLYKDVSQRLREAQEELELSNKKHTSTIERYKEELDIVKNLYEDKLESERILENSKMVYLRELENVKILKDKELNELKQMSAKKVEEETKRLTEHAQKMIENAEAVTKETLAACRAESEERVKRTIVECDTKVNAMIRNTQDTVEEEMQLAAERYKICLVRMEVERTALDEKLLQRDAEITKLSVTLEELRSSVETQESFSQSLQTELDRAEAELAEKKEELRSLKNHIRAEAAEMVARRKRFEIIMAENQASVAALTNRLTQSNAEVERLQHELKRGEDCIHEHRDLLSVMRNNSQLVHEQVHALMEELDAQRELVGQLEAGSLSEFESIKPVFEAKIENLKQMATKEIAKLQNECEMKSLQNDEMKEQLNEMVNNLSKAQDLLLKLEERADSQAVDISRLELMNSKLVEQLKNREKALEESNQLIQAQTTQYKKNINKANSRLEELSKKVKEPKDKEKCTEETSLLEQERVKWKTLETALMQQFQEERARREEIEEEAKKITELNSRLKTDYEEISEKYAEIIGHQNPKQRIKHVTQLKDKIYQLEQELCAKTRLVEQQQKTIKNFKAEEKRSHWKGKENLGMVHSTPVSSPHKLLATPLRNRND